MPVCVADRTTLTVPLREDPLRLHPSTGPIIMKTAIRLLGIVFMAFFYTWVYNGTRSILLCMLLHGSFDTATGAFPAPFDALQREVYVTLLVVQDITLLAALAILIGATR